MYSLWNIAQKHKLSKYYIFEENFSHLVVLVQLSLSSSSLPAGAASWGSCSAEMQEVFAPLCHTAASAFSGTCSWYTQALSGSPCRQGQWTLWTVVCWT